MKLEVGMYVRYGGVIKKIKEIVDFNEREYKLNGLYINKKSIQKASYNIMDLIEVGDYVNGEIVKSIPLTKCIDGLIGFRIANCTNNDIKSIVTKELFEIAEYRIGE